LREKLDRVTDVTARETRGRRNRGQQEELNMITSTQVLFWIAVALGVASSLMSFS